MFVNVLTVRSAVKMVNVLTVTTVVLLVVDALLLTPQSVSAAVSGASVLNVHAMITNVAQVRVAFLEMIRRFSKINEIKLSFHR